MVKSNESGGMQVDSPNMSTYGTCSNKPKSVKVMHIPW